MAIKNVLFPGAADIQDNELSNADSAHYRLSKAKVAYFNGATAWPRLALFIKGYVNAATLNDGGDATDPSDYTITDRGLASGAVISVYMDGGMVVLLFQDYSEYDANTFPFNLVPSPDAIGW